MEFWFGLEIRYHYESGLRPYWKYWVQNLDVRTPVFFNRWILTFINGLNIGVIPKSDKIIRSSVYGWGFTIVLVTSDSMVQFYLMKNKANPNPKNSGQ